MYQEALRKLIIKGIIGFVIGFILALCISPEFGFWGYCIIGFVMAGVPYGWELVGRVIGGFVVGHIAIMIVSFILRAAASMLIGWIAYPIALVYHIVMACRKSNE